MKKQRKPKKADAIPGPEQVQTIALDALRVIEGLCASVAAAQMGSDETFGEGSRGPVARKLRGLESKPPRRITTHDELVTHVIAEAGRALRRAAELPWSVLGTYGTDNLAPVAAGRIRAHSAVAATAALARWWLELGSQCQPSGDDEAMLGVAWEVAGEIQRLHHIAALRVQVRQECYRRQAHGSKRAMHEPSEAIEIRKAERRSAILRVLRSHPSSPKSVAALVRWLVEARLPTSRDTLTRDLREMLRLGEVAPDELPPVVGG